MAGLKKKYTNNGNLEVYIAPTGNARLSADLPPVLMRQVALAASARNQSRSDFVRDVLDMYFKRARIPTPEHTPMETKLYGADSRTQSTEPSSDTPGD